jgi:putative OPT family oligopeptide transporter
MAAQFNTNASYIPADQHLPEITFKAIVLSFILTILLAAANAYLGLKVGITISASIPAAVISMGVLRFFKNSNVLENNIVQTAASAGETLAAGIIFTVPALIILGFWKNFNYIETIAIAGIGGILGILFSIPLRRVLLADPNLTFPEGTAIGNVLKISANKSAGLKYLVWGSGLGGVLALAQLGFKIFSEGVLMAFTIGGQAIIGYGFGFSPALIGAGYIVGERVALGIFIGTVISWLIALPILSSFSDLTTGQSPEMLAKMIASTNIRYIGVGVLLTSGFWTIIKLTKPMIAGINASLGSVKLIASGKGASIPRTERDIPITYVFWGSLISIIPLILLFIGVLDPTKLGISETLNWSLTITGVVYSIVAGFIFSSICGYLAGLVGTSSSPISATTLGAILIISLILFVIVTGELAIDGGGDKALPVAALAITIGAVIASASSIANDTMQDLKAGYMLGATPWKQQLMLVFGVVLSALVIPPVLELLLNAYGIGEIMPRPGMDPEQTLAAPQAHLMAAIAKGVFTQNVPWHLLGVGFLIGVVAIAFDEYLARANKNRLPPLAIGLGIYLPIISSTALMLGGVVAYFVKRKWHQWEANSATKELVGPSEHRGLLIASGLVAGAALMGIFLAVPFSLLQSTDALRLIPESFDNWAIVAGSIVTLGLLGWIYREVCFGKS